MRETWARRIAFLTGGLVVVLAMLFAYLQNPPRVAAPEPGTAAAPATAAPPEPAMATAPPVQTSRPAAALVPGQQVYADLACARCHSIGGRGNARSLLDDVGVRLSEAQIRAWVTSAGADATGFQARHANLDLTPEQRDALVAYLLSLRG